MANPFVHVELMCAKRATLTAPARDGTSNVRAGTEGRAPQGPNKRMGRKSSRRRTP
jgi:hypothetical protein